MRLIEHLPDALQEVREYYYVMFAGQSAIDAPGNATAAVNLMLENFFILTADEATIQRWESILSLTDVSDSLDSRRWAVINALYNQKFFTVRGLRARLDAVLGAGRYIFFIAYEDYYLFLRPFDADKVDETNAWLRVVIPANLAMYVGSANTHGYLKNSLFTHAFLHSYTHKQIKEDIIT